MSKHEAQMEALVVRGRREMRDHYFKKMRMGHFVWWTLQESARQAAAEAWAEGYACGQEEAYGLKREEFGRCSRCHEMTSVNDPCCPMASVITDGDYYDHG